MAINPTTAGIHHIGLRSMDFEKTKNFYQNVLGFPLIIDKPDLLIFTGAGTILLSSKLIQEIKIFPPLALLKLDLITLQ
jgi:catechol 2,3-dioxygenase-like lactoylglutathione lyase family enzyme